MVPENSRYLLNCRRSIGNGDFTASLRRVTQRTNVRGWFINKPRQPFQEGSDKNKARFQGFSSSYKDMFPESFMRICKTGTLAATLVVPMLAHADPFCPSWATGGKARSMNYESERTASLGWAIANPSLGAV